MKIQGLISNIPVLKSAKSNFLSDRYFSSVDTSQNDVFELSPEAKIKKCTESILSRTHKFTIADYKSLTKLEKSILRRSSEEAKQAAKDSIQVGLKLKEKLDNRYGENSYVFCSIGTSPSGVARVMEFSGVETKYLPISGLRYFHHEEVFRKFDKKFPTYKQFLEEQGISKDSIEKSGKHFLFYDYTMTGESLRVFRRILEERLGIDSKLADCYSFDYACYSASAKHIDPADYAVDYVKKYVRDEKMENYGGIDHLPIWKIDEIDKCKKYSNNDAKLFNFFVIDELNKRQLLKYNPLNKKSL